MYVSVAIDNSASGRLFDYAVPDQLAGRATIGSKVSVSFGRRMATAYVAATKDSLDFKGKVKPIQAVLEENVIPAPLVKLAVWMASYYMAPVDKCISTLLPAPVRSGRAHEVVQLFIEATGKCPDGLTTRQKELRDNIERVGGGWMRQVCIEFSTTSATLRKLAETGAVTIEERSRRRNPLAHKRILPSRPLPLNDGQAAALSTITGEMAKPAPRPVLLFGVTGSGKTEVYLQAIAKTLDSGKGAIVLVPEIALTPQTVQRFASRFGDKIAVLHSALSDGERFDEWKRIKNGEAHVVVGPRSAVFAPVANLGLIIVDEEHEPSYKQEDTPRYNARDTAVMRAYIEGCPIVLGSATPSLESWNNAKTGKYILASLSKRAVPDAVMPLVHIKDMRVEAAMAGGPIRIFSKELLDAIKLRLDRGEQTMLFLNRRGYSTSQTCPECGYTATCPNCDIPYTYHRSDDALRCHICGKWERPGSKCPECESPEFKYSGIGTQKIEQIVKKCFPRAHVARMDADSTSRKFSHDDILAEFRSGKTDILVGTQMIAKGLDFPNVTLVGIIMADTSLHMPDFRAGERTFQLLAQVAGRTGRGSIAGEVFVQTFTPDHPAVQNSRTENFEEFAKGELDVRSKGFYPPFCRMACITISGKDEDAVSRTAAAISRKMAFAGGGTVLVSEAVPAALAKANGNFRYQVMARAKSVAAMSPAIRSAIAGAKAPTSIKVAIDIDAMSF